MEEEQKRHYNKNSYFEKIDFQEGNGMKKKRLAMALAVAVTIAVLGGCGTKEEQKTGEKVPATEEAPEADTGKTADETTAAGSGDAVNLKVYSWHAERADLYEEIFSEFNKLYPNITATYITYDFYSNSDGRCAGFVCDQRHEKGGVWQLCGYGSLHASG